VRREREEHENSKTTLQRAARPHIDRMHVHTQGTLVNERERDRGMRVVGKANDVKREGILLMWSPRGVCANLLRATSVRDYKTLSSIDRNKPTTPAGATRVGDNDMVEFG